MLLSARDESRAGGSFKENEEASSGKGVERGRSPVRTLGTGGTDSSGAAGRNGWTTAGRNAVSGRKAIAAGRRLRIGSAGLWSAPAPAAPEGAGKLGTFSPGGICWTTQRQTPSDSTHEARRQ